MSGIITGDRIPLFRKLTLLRMLGLEMKGMGRRGRSAYAIIKSETGFKGNRQKVHDQYAAQIATEEIELGIPQR